MGFDEQTKKSVTCMRALTDRMVILRLTDQTSSGVDGCQMGVISPIDDMTMCVTKNITQRSEGRIDIRAGRGLQFLVGLGLD